MTVLPIAVGQRSEVNPALAFIKTLGFFQLTQPEPLNKVQDSPCLADERTSFVSFVLGNLCRKGPGRRC